MPLKKILFILLTLGLLFLLFSHPAHAAAGCSLGLKLWYTSVLPSLLPFLIVSNLLIQTGMFQYLNRLYTPVLGRIFRISDEGCYAVLIGFLCGFPMGAKVVGDLVRQKRLSLEEGEYLLGFCNNVSPAFFLNYICLLKLQYQTVPWGLVGLFYGLPLFYGFLTRPFYHFETCWKTKKQASLHRIDFPMLDACIMDGFTTITRLGGYIMLFTILVQMLKLLPFTQSTLAFVSALLEISCGIHEITALPEISALWKTAFACTTAAFGGLCICAQTQSVLTDTPLQIHSWLRGRMIIALLTFLLLLLPTVAPVLPGCC